MKILHLEAGTQIYGGPAQLLLLLEGLARRGVENLLLCPSHSPIIDKARPHARIITMESRRWRRLPQLLGSLRALQQEHPDLLHVHSRRGADYTGALAAALKGTPCILSRRVDNPEPGWLARFKYGRYDRVVTISEGIRQILLDEGVPAARIRCVRSAIDPTPWLQSADRPALLQAFALPADAQVLAVVAQLVPRKGHTHLLQALATLRDSHPRAHLLVFGQGGLDGELRALGSRLGLDERVHFAGFRTDLPTLLPAVDLVVHPALMEGLGVSLIQAAATGRPIIASRAGGMPEIVRDGENGLLVPPGDEAALARAIATLLDNPARAHAMGQRGRQLALEEFSADAMVEGNLAIYQEVLEERR